MSVGRDVLKSRYADVSKRNVSAVHTCTRVAGVRSSGWVGGAVGCTGLCVVLFCFMPTSVAPYAVKILDFASGL